MTIAISLKVNDGVVLAADSASTLIMRDQQGNAAVAKVFDNANKVFNLHKRLPVGSITWGVGAIGKESIGTLTKDFRRKLSEGSQDGYKLDVNNYTVEDIATKFRRFIYDEHYVKAFEKYKEKPDVGFIISGFSSHRSMAEEWEINIDRAGQCHGPKRVRAPDSCGVSWRGQPEAIARLYWGHSGHLSEILKASGLDQAKIDEVIGRCKSTLSAQFLYDPMPIHDAIELGAFLVEVTKKYTRFIPGAATVGGPTEIAAVTKHEGFKWVSRKFYFDQALNPLEA